MRCSICMATRNKAVALNGVLASIRRQTIPFEYEIVVADDGSTDNTREVCRQYDVRYLYLDNARYRNPARARNDTYRFATGEVVIAQSDDVIHVSDNAVRDLVAALRPGSVAIATVLNMVAGTTVSCHNPFHAYSGPDQPRAFFFLGALWRKDLYAFGGNDEEFVEPCWDDNWFEDCLIKGLQLDVRYAQDVIGHHQSHDHPAGSHRHEELSRSLYFQKVKKAQHDGVYTASPPWSLEQATIPKQMSFFWGGKTMSWMRYITLASFRYWHPEWTMRLYRMEQGELSKWSSHEKEDATAYDGSDNYLERLGELDVEVIPWISPLPGASVTHASDLCQWEILSSDGGFYSDMDVLYVGPIDYRTVGQADVTFCLSLGYMTIGFLGASPNSPVFELVRNQARWRYNPRVYQSTGAEAIYTNAGIGDDWMNHEGPGRIAVAHFRNTFPCLRFRELPSETFYPWNYMETEKIFSQTHEVPLGCVGIHWFGANPLSQRWNNLLTESNLRAFASTFTKYAGLCGWPYGGTP